MGGVLEHPSKVLSLAQNAILPLFSHLLATAQLHVQAFGEYCFADTNKACNTTSRIAKRLTSEIPLTVLGSEQFRMLSDTG